MMNRQEINATAAKANPSPRRPWFHSREDGFIEMHIGSGTFFLIHPEYEGQYFATAHDEFWASCPAGNHATVLDAMQHCLNSFTFPPRQ